MNNYLQPYYREYLIKKFTFQHFFYIFLWYLIIALPFYFSFGGQNFWLNTHEKLMNCQYNFTGLYAIQVNSIQGGTQSVQEQMSNIIGYPSNKLTLSLSKINIVDQAEKMSVQFQINGYSNKQIIDVNIVFYYKVYIPELDKQINVALVQNYPGDHSYVQKVSYVTYSPQKALNLLNNIQKMNYPPYYPNFQPPSSFQALIDNIIQNDEVHRLDQEQFSQTTTSKKQAKRLFKLNLIKDTQINLPYYPKVLQTLKFAFSRWFAFVLIAYFVFNGLLGYLVKDGAIVTKVRDQIVR